MQKLYGCANNYQTGENKNLGVERGSGRDYTWTLIIKMRIEVIALEKYGWDSSLRSRNPVEIFSLIG
jgi:hypothetical protein